MHHLKIVIFSIVFIILKPSFSFAQQLDTPLFKISHNNKIGFIDIHGNIVILPQFIQAGDFSNEIAEARKEGLYGYINKKGDFEIKPQFEFALPFHNERAIVYQKARPLVIDKKGKIIVDNHNFVSISSFNENLALVTTSSGKQGVINEEGKLAIDTVFSRVRNFEDGVAIVYGLNHIDNEVV